MKLLLPFLLLLHSAIAIDYRCKSPPERGPCKASLPRWYYAHRLNDCRPFTYGGCRGNPNNFGSKHACEEFCKVKKKNLMQEKRTAVNNDADDSSATPLPSLTRKVSGLDLPLMAFPPLNNTTSGDSVEEQPTQLSKPLPAAVTMARQADDRPTMDAWGDESETTGAASEEPTTTKKTDSPDSQLNEGTNYDSANDYAALQFSLEDKNLKEEDWLENTPCNGCNSTTAMYPPHLKKPTKKKTTKSSPKHSGRKRKLRSSDESNEDEDRHNEGDVGDDDISRTVNEVDNKIGVGKGVKGLVKKVSG